MINTNEAIIAESSVMANGDHCLFVKLVIFQDHFKRDHTKVVLTTKFFQFMSAPIITINCMDVYFYHFS